MKTAFDKERVIGPKYDVGEVVFMKQAPQQTGQPTKTQPKYRGPMVVSKVLPGDTYRVNEVADKSNGHLYASTAHCSQLKGWKSLT